MEQDECFDQLAALQEKIESNVAAGDQWAIDVDTAINGIIGKYAGPTPEAPQS